MKFLNANVVKKTPKATIHVTGKLGFNNDAKDLMGLNKDLYFHIGVDDNGYNETFYLIGTENAHEKAAKVIKAGNYYYLNLAGLFTELGLNYTEDVYAYDIEKTTFNQKEGFCLKQREVEKRNKKVNQKPTQEVKKSTIEDDDDGLPF